MAIRRTRTTRSTAPTLTAGQHEAVRNLILRQPDVFSPCLYFPWLADGWQPTRPQREAVLSQMVAEGTVTVVCDAGRLAGSNTRLCLYKVTDPGMWGAA